jgi:tetratricopeptide (TPR) repeat protein
MKRRAALLLGLALPAAALAQGAPRAAELDQLFAVLRDSQDAAQIAMVEARIRQLWIEAASPAARLLLQRGTRNLNARLPEEAIEDFDAAVTLAPNAASAWHLRAEALAALGQTREAARDLAEALRLEPRHFIALQSLSRLQTEAGDAAGALRSLEAALALYPALPGGAEALRRLKTATEGQAL